MLGRFGRHVRQQFVGYIALFIALGGTAYAAVTITGEQVKDGSLSGFDIKNGSINTADLRNNSIRGADIREGAVNSDDIEDGSITTDDFHPTTFLSGPKGDTGATGAKGDKGDKGETGAKGAPGATNVVTRWGEVMFVSNDVPRASYAACQPGETATGGGYQVFSVAEGADYQVFQDRPVNPSIDQLPKEGEKAIGWVVAIENNANPFEFIAFVLCASP